jgi:hypothetical protein
MALRRRDGMLLDLAIDLLLPPLASIAGLVGGGLLVALAVRAPVPLRAAWLGCALALYAYVLRGWSLSGTGVGGLVDLAGAPFYMAWKLWVRVTGPSRVSEWVRTTRSAR